MAKLIYYTEDYGDANFVRVFENEAKMTAANYPKWKQASIDITAEEYNQAKMRTNVPFGVKNGAVVWNGPLPISTTREDFEQYVKYQIYRLYCSLRDYPNHPDASTMQSMKTALEGFNFDSLTYPLTSTLEQVCESQNIPYIGTDCIP